MPGEVYRENSSDDAQGYQPFSTFTSIYLIIFIYQIHIWYFFDEFDAKLKYRKYTEYLLISRPFYFLTTFVYTSYLAYVKELKIILELKLNVHILFRP